MSIKDQAIGVGRKILTGFGLVVVGIAAIGAFATLAPGPATIFLWILGIVSGVALFTRINAPILRSKWWAALGLVLAIGMSGVVMSARDKELATLKANDPVAYLAWSKANRSDAEYLTSLKELDPLAYEAETTRRAAAAADKAERQIAEATANAEQERVDYAAQLRREVEGFKDFKPEKYVSTRDEIVLGLALIGAWVKIYDEGSNFALTPEEAALRTTLRAKTIEAQRKAFPLYRRKWAEALDAALWEENIDVGVVGSRATTIEFVGGSFAANRNIGQTQAELSDILTQLRFKRSQYRWYKGADEYTYYTLAGSLDDGVFARITNNGWMKIADEAPPPASPKARATAESVDAGDTPSATTPPNSEASTGLGTDDVAPAPNGSLDAPADGGN